MVSWVATGGSPLAEKTSEWKEVALVLAEVFDLKNWILVVDGATTSVRGALAPAGRG